MRKLNIILGFLIIITVLFCSMLFSYAETYNEAELKSGEAIEENTIGPNELKRPKVSNIDQTLYIDWDIQLTTNVARGFIVKTSQKTRRLNIRTLDPNIAEAKVVDVDDERGYYCEIIGKRAGKTTLILEDSGTVLEKEVTVSGPELRVDWDIQLTTNVARGFIVKTSQK
ncbi:MAG: hypothetical protein PUK21_03165, partial [Peptostreptococcaceae bacterium]|nr:hypothetical protein [Peptostreptococcaceae bacterium]